MTVSHFRPIFLLVVLAVLAGAALASTSLASADAPDRWHNETCHDLDSGRVLCIEDKGSLKDSVSASGQWTYHYRGDTLWTVYAADGSVEYTERTKVHVVQKGDGSETHREHETLRYRYQSDEYSCQVSTKLIVSNGEVQVEHGTDNCLVS